MPLNVNLQPFQADFIRSTAKFPCFVGGWGTGKSMCAIIRAVHLSEAYPGNLGVIFRKEYTDLRDSTIKDFEDYTGLKLDSHRDVKFSNGSTIMFRHMEEVQRGNLQNINLGWFWIEQAEELDSDEGFFLLFGRLRRKNVGKQLGMLTANSAGRNWIYKLWKNSTLDDGELFEATTYDNEKNLPESFLKSLETLKKNKPSIYNRFVMNSWDDDDVDDSFIQAKDFDFAYEHDIMDKQNRSFVVVDPADGGDETVCYHMVETDVKDSMILHLKNTMHTAGRISAFMEKKKTNVVGGDVIGVGKGVFDRLDELGRDVHYINSSERRKSGVDERFYNRRAEMWWNAGEMFQEGKVVLTHRDDKLREQLLSVKYTVRNGRILAEPKKDVKERLGCSPDRGDTYVMGLWMLDSVEETEVRDRYFRRRDEEDYPFNPMTV